MDTLVSISSTTDYLPYWLDRNCDCCCKRRLLEQDEQKVDATKKTLAEKQAAEEQDADVTKSS